MIWNIDFIYKSNPSPIGSMCGIFTYIYHTNQLNVGKYTVRPMDPMAHLYDGFSPRGPLSKLRASPTPCDSRAMEQEVETTDMVPCMVTVTSGFA